MTWVDYCLRCKASSYECLCDHLAWERDQQMQQQQQEEEQQQQEDNLS